MSREWTEMKNGDVCDGHPIIEALEGRVRKGKNVQMTAVLSTQLLLQDGILSCHVWVFL